MAYLIKDKNDSPVLHNGKEIYACDFLTSIKSVDIKKRTLTIIGSDETVDRDGDIIRVNGWLMDNYQKNPVFLWSHNYSSIPLGATSQLIRRRNPARLEFKDIRFPTEGLNPFADMILQLYHEGIINASSVGFIPFKWNDLEKDEENRTQWRAGREFIKQELLELSGCAVPSNPNALQMALKGKSFAGDYSPDDLVMYLTGEMTIPELKHKDDILEELTIKLPLEIIEEEGKVQIQVTEDLEKKEETEFEFNFEFPTIEMRDSFRISTEDLGEELKPYPNEHACRLAEPNLFSQFRRGTRDHEGKKYSIIYGKKKSDGKWGEQAYRYNKETWTASTAKKHCKTHKGSFEAASDSNYEGNDYNLFFNCEANSQFEELPFGEVILRGNYTEEDGIIIASIEADKIDNLDGKDNESTEKGESQLIVILSQEDKDWLKKTIEEIISKSVLTKEKQEISPESEKEKKEAEKSEVPELSNLLKALNELKKVSTELQEVFTHAG